MKSLRITVKGRVQRAGYRNFVDEAAYSLGVRGQVKNLEDGSVGIIAQHESGEVLGEFAEKIGVSRYPIHVRSVSKEELDVAPFEEFDIVRGDLAREQSERLDEASFYLSSLTGEVRAHREETREGFASLGSKMDAANEKLDTGNEKLDSFAGSTSSRFDVVDNKYGKISHQLDKISGSLDELVSVLKRFAPHKG